jgi:hypothetical protein
MRRLFPFERGPARICAALFLILIFAGFTFLQAVHVHGEVGQADAHCTICAAAHAPAILILPVPLPGLISAEVRVVLSAPPVRSRSRLTSLYSRPPPPIA